MDGQLKGLPRGYVLNYQLLRQLLTDWKDERVGNKGESES